MKLEEKKVLEVRLEGEEVDTFKALMKKTQDAVILPGFTGMRLEEKEKDLLKELNK
jgi:hypothetical protein